MKTLIAVVTFLLFGVAAMAEDTTAKIKVKGMTCGACAVAVKRALTTTKGVKSADVNVEKGLATVVYDPKETKEQQLREAINKTGFTAEPQKETK